MLFRFLKSQFITAHILLGSAMIAEASCPPGSTVNDIAPPTDVERTFIRSGLGEYAASRASGNPHTGIDIVTRASYEDQMAYAVFAMADGVVAYAQFNGSDLDKGFGNVIIVDHTNDCYTMYAHLSSDPFTPMGDPDAALMVRLGDNVKRGQLIGYFVDHESGVHSTGNAMRTSAGARWQTHIEFIDAPSGRSGPGLIGDIVSPNGKRTDPTAALLTLGYSISDIVN